MCSIFRIYGKINNILILRKQELKFWLFGWTRCFLTAILETLCYHVSKWSLADMLNFFFILTYGILNAICFNLGKIDWHHARCLWYWHILTIFIILHLTRLLQLETIHFYFHYFQLKLIIDRFNINFNLNWSCFNE